MLKTIKMMFYTLTTLTCFRSIFVKMITVPVSCAAAVELEALVEDTMENKKRGVATKNNWKSRRKTILEPGWCE